MQTSNADKAGGPPLVEANLAVPVPGPGELLVEVHAAGVTPSELEWYPTTHTREGRVRAHAVPGHEFAGVVAVAGEGVEGFKAGDAVYGMSDWFADGATAEFCVAASIGVAPMPKSLSFAEGAAVPIAALTAWQGLARASIKAGDRVLVLGGSGSVGGFAVQLAKMHGGHVLATASVETLDWVRALGADQAFDYRSVDLRRDPGSVDVVFDTVGGETLAAAWSALGPGGRLVTVASSSEGLVDERTKAAFFIVEPNAEQLGEIGRMLDSGSLMVTLKAVVPFEDAAAAYAGALPNVLSHGKVVVELGDVGRVFLNSDG